MGAAAVYVMVRTLAEECGHKTAKGEQNLRRIARGLWPHPKGMPKKVQEALHWRDANRAVTRANAKVHA